VARISFPFMFQRLAGLLTARSLAYRVDATKYVSPPAKTGGPKTKVGTDVGVDPAGLAGLFARVSKTHGNAVEGLGDVFGDFG